MRQMALRIKSSTVQTLQTLLAFTSQLLLDLTLFSAQIMQTLTHRDTWKEKFSIGLFYE